MYGDTGHAPEKTGTSCSAVEEEVGSSRVGAIEKIMKLLGKVAADLTQNFKLDVIPGLVLLLGDIECGPDQKPGEESFSICGGMEAMLLESGVCNGQVGFTAAQVGSHGWCLELVNITFVKQLTSLQIGL